MLHAIPLTIIPLVLYNVFAYAFGAEVWTRGVLELPMLSGQRWTMTAGDLMIVLGVVCLFVEVLKSARSGTHTITNHVLSTAVLIVYVIEFMVAGPAASSVFFILTLIALFDVIAGFSISIRTATRDIAFSPHIDGQP